MKFIATLLLLSAPALAQTAPKPASPTAASAPHPATHPVAHPPTHPAAAACVKLPALSPKVPALPAGASCAKALYTLTITPPVKLDYASPLEGPELRTYFNIEDPATFSLDYIDTEVGPGELAAPNKYYTLHYTGYLTDGTKFDSSFDHPGQEPFTFQYGKRQVIPGWDTGIAGMHVGGKRRIFVPWQLAYGAAAHGAIPARSELIFDVELISQSDSAPAPKTPPVAPTVSIPKPTQPTPPAASPQPATPPPPTATPATPPKP